VVSEVRFQTGINTKHNKRSALLSSKAHNYADRFAHGYLITVSMKFDKVHCSTQHFEPVPVSNGSVGNKFVELSYTELADVNWVSLLPSRQLKCMTLVSSDKCVNVCSRYN
jgi:hypothetical protein